MTLKIKILFLALIVGGVAGCSTNYEPIYFASDVKPPTFKEGDTLATGGLSKAEEKNVQLAVFAYLLEHNAGDVGNASAVFLQADDDVVSALLKKYPAHQPPIKTSDHIDLRVNQLPLDRDTGRPVMILAAEISDPGPDGSVRVIGRWYSGTTVTQSYTFTMRKTGEVWTIASVH